MSFSILKFVYRERQIDSKWGRKQEEVQNSSFSSSVQCSVDCRPSVAVDVKNSGGPAFLVQA